MRAQHTHRRFTYVCPDYHKFNDDWAAQFAYRRSVRWFHLSELAVGYRWTKKHKSDYWAQLRSSTLLPPFDRVRPDKGHPSPPVRLVDHYCYYNHKRKPALILTHTYLDIGTLINEQRALRTMGLTFIEPAKVSWYYPYNATVLGICRADALCADGLVIENAHALRRVYHSQQGFKPRLVKSSS